MLSIMERAPWLMNNTPQGYHEQYEASIKRMFNGGVMVEPIERVSNVTAKGGSKNAQNKENRRCRT